MRTNDADGSATGIFQQVFGETVVRPGDTQPVLDEPGLVQMLKFRA